MVNDMLADATKMAGTADLLRTSADDMHDLRTAALNAGRMTVRQFRANAAAEAELRNSVSEMVVLALDKVVDGAQGAQQDLEDAIKQANDRIKTLKDLKQVLDIFATLIALAAAITTLKPVPIVEAVLAVKKTVGAA